MVVGTFFYDIILVEALVNYQLWKRVGPLIRVRKAS